MITLVSLERAKEQLRITHTFEDAEILSFCEQATGIVIDYLKQPELVEGSPPEWDEATVPAHVQAAILQVVVNLYRHRGDDGEAPGPISPRVVSLLMRTRDPALA